MKVVINGEDKSGKGIRESEAALAEYIPDLTSNLIGSIIILGQGLPCKFSNNTPAGRKEVLEKLSKSDFMIQDLKDRLNNRNAVLLDVKRKYEDSILSSESKKSVLNTQHKTNEDKLTELLKPHDFESEITNLQDNITTMESSVNERKKTLNESVTKVNTLNESLRSILNEKSKKLDSYSAEFNTFNSEYLSRKYKLEADIRTLDSEIKKLKSITDICPTCGQKIPGAKKPDTTEKEKDLNKLRKDLEELNSKFKVVQESYQQDITDTNNQYKKSIDDLETEIRTKNSFNQKEDLDIKNIDGEILKLKAAKLKAELNKENHLKQIETVKSTLTELDKQIEELDKAIESDKLSAQDNDSHLNVISQMLTLIKRDFRGFLLSNVISFIDAKAKEYANDIFGTNELDFKLDGNNIDIIYCNKMFESLSGGEKQKVDLIIQFAIRDMMSKYLDFSSNILVLDEITDNLDSIGCTNVLNLISSKLNDVESIFIISHHASELAIPCDSEMVVIKDRNGISSIK